MVAHQTMFGLFAVLDGVRFIEDRAEKGEFRLLFKRGDQQWELNPPEGVSLHDLLNQSAGQGVVVFARCPSSTRPWGGCAEVTEGKRRPRRATASRTLVRSQLRAPDGAGGLLRRKAATRKRRLLEKRATPRRDASREIASWAYSQVEATRGHLWLRGYSLVQLEPTWRSLLAA